MVVRRCGLAIDSLVKAPEVWDVQHRAQDAERERGPPDFLVVPAGGIVGESKRTALAERDGEECPIGEHVERPNPENEYENGLGAAQLAADLGDHVNPCDLKGRCVGNRGWTYTVFLFFFNSKTARCRCRGMSVAATLEQAGPVRSTSHDVGAGTEMQKASRLQSRTRSLPPIGATLCQLTSMTMTMTAAAT